MIKNCKKTVVVEINSYNHGSTGSIMLQTAELARLHGFEVYTCCPESRSNKGKQVNHQICIGHRVLRNIHLFFGYLTGFNECFSVIDTINFLKKLDIIKPDIIHIHNLHGAYINVPMLFRYIKKNNIRVIWTLHDCWAFTGHCPHFTMVECNKWKTGCYSCPEKSSYPETLIDSSRYLYKMKKKWFTGVEDLTIVTPSMWLSDLVKQSFLQNYPVKVINNGIDLEVFKPRNSKFREKYGISDKVFLILGIAFVWGEKKGLDVFVQLAKRLDTEKFKIVLVGTNDEVDLMLPSNIISIHRTSNQQQLAEIYSTADVFVNPTREETFSLVNIESLACGTPVITFCTGGSPECIDEKTGIVVPYNDTEKMISTIEMLRENMYFRSGDCTKRAEKFSLQDKHMEYVRLYAKED